MSSLARAGQAAQDVVDGAGGGVEVDVAAHAALGESSDDNRDEHQLDDIDDDENDNCVNTVNDDNDVGV